SGLLAREVAHRVRGADYRAMGAAGYLGVGSVWALGLSSSAALIMAAPASLPQSIQQISGVIPLSQTLGLWQGMFIAAVLIVASMWIAVYSHPTSAYARDMEAMGGEVRTRRAACSQTGKTGRVAGIQSAADDPHLIFRDCIPGSGSFR